MKLVQLYSNDKRFKVVKFSPGFNIVLGKITDEDNLNRDCHNLGKTRLIELIDFMLLKELKKGNYLKKPQFKDHVFYLEIELNDGRYLTIKRAIKKNTKISLKISKTKFNNFIDEINWDYEDLPLNSKDISINPKYIVNSLLSFNVFPDENYRTYLNYFLRTQNDYSDEFHLSKYNGPDSDWKPQLFELLGFSGAPLKSKYNLEKDLLNQNRYIKKLETEIGIDSLQADKLKGLIQINEKEKLNLETTLSKFNFYNNDKNINRSLVDEIECKISKLNSIRYNLEMEISSLNNSFEKDLTFNLDSTLEIFNEVKIYFSEQLKKSYEDLVEFNKTLTIDRNKYIAETIKSKSNKLDEIDSELKQLNARRINLLSTLTQTDVFKKYKLVESNLIKIERDLEKYTNKLYELSAIEREQDSANKISDNISELKSIIKSEIDVSNDMYLRIRDCFSEYVKEILGKPGLLSIYANSNGNVEFNSEISEIYKNETITTSEGDGHTYKKILCACFDLSLLINYSDKSFFKFIFHDGCLESLDPRRKKKYLDLVLHLCKEYNIQYILSLIESDIPTIAGKKYIFDDTCNLAVELSDLDDNTTLFGFKF